MHVLLSTTSFLQHPVYLKKDGYHNCMYVRIKVKFEETTINLENIVAFAISRILKLSAKVQFYNNIPNLDFFTSLVHT